jgi:hypothetical protein
MLSKRSIAIAIVLVLMVAVPAMSADQQTTPLGQEAQMQAVLVAVNATFDNEAWKYDQQYAGSAFGSPEEFEAHITNESSSYFSAMGYAVALDIKIIDAQGNAVTDENIDINVKIDTSQGEVRPFKARDADSPEIFHLRFDVDGAIHGGPEAKNLPPLPDGLQVLDVEIVETAPAADDLPQGQNTISFYYDRPEIDLQIPTPRPAQRMLPDSMFRLYNDLGYGDTVPVFDQPIGLDRNVTVTFAFGVPNAAVTLNAFVAARGVPEYMDSPAGGQPLPGGTVPVPHMPGVTDSPAVQNALSTMDTLVAVSKTQLAQGVTDDAGFATFEFTPSQATQSAALLLVSAELASPVVPPGQPTGGPDVRVGSGEFLLPVVAQGQLDSPVNAVSFSVAPASNDDPAEVRQVNRLQARFVDPLGSATEASRGDLFAVEPQQGRLLASASLSPDTNPARQDRHRVGELPTRAIQVDQVSLYRVYAFLYGSNDVFYTAAYADRGFVLDLAAPQTTVGQQGVFYINVTSATTNYDNNPQESGFELPVRVTAEGVDLSLNFSESIQISEGQVHTITVPISAASAGSYPVAVNAWSPDAVHPEQEILVRFVRPSDDRSFVDRIPGFEVVAVFAAAAVAAVWVARRRHD